MKCSLCGDTKDYNVLYRCPYCNRDFCETHINNHNCPHNIIAQPITGIFNQFYQPQYREPTDKEKEEFLRRNPNVLTTGRESFDLLIAFALITFVFAFQPLLTGTQSIAYIIMLTVVIGPAFILHELGHKYSAIKYGKYARFTLIKNMVGLTVLVGILGIGIAGPGATMIVGRTNKKESGIFASAGPLVNLVIALISFLLIIITPNAFISLFNQSIHSVLTYAVIINSFLALFNLIPFSLLDGKKIIAWNPLAWILLVIANGLLFISAI